jgi:hypothetical protein
MVGRGLIFSKESVRIGRLIASASAFPLLYAAAGALSGRALVFARWLLLPFGRHSLLAFVLHLLAVVGLGCLVRLAGASASLPPLTNAGLQLLAAAFVWLSIVLRPRLQLAPPRRVALGAKLGLAWQGMLALTR